MLLGPQLFEQGGDPAVDGAQPMQTGVAGAAEGDQGRGGGGGTAVVDDERLWSPADAAEPAVAAEDLFAPPGEAGAVAPAAVIAGFAQPAAEELGFSAGAAERDLRVRIEGHEKVLIQPTIRSIIIGDFRLKINPADGPKETRQNSSGGAISPGGLGPARGHKCLSGAPGAVFPRGRRLLRQNRGEVVCLSQDRCYAPQETTMSEDERQEMVRTIAEAHDGLKEVAFKLRRQLPSKSPALRAAVKAEQEAFRLKRELQRLTLEDPEQARRHGTFPEVRRGDKVIDPDRLRW